MCIYWSSTPQDRCLESRKQPQKCVQAPVAQRSPRHPETLLAWRTVVAVLLCRILRRRSDLHRAAVHRAAADTTLKPKDGYAVRAILPRPERPGLSRTGSGVFCDDAYGAEDGQDSNHQNGPDANDDNIIERTPSADSRGLNRSHPISFPQEKLPRRSRLSLFSFRI